MANLSLLETIFPENYREAFENMATLMFCTELGLTHGVSRRKRQNAIESDPVQIDGRVYAYQAKYYEPQVELKKRKKDLVDSIMGAADIGVTNLMLFVNKDREPRNKFTNEENSYLKEIEDTAKLQNVKLDWWDLSKIQDSLEMPAFCYIKSIYCDTEENKKLARFYETVSKKVEKRPPKGSVYGSISLKDGYIQPYILAGRENQSVKNYLEKWISKGGEIMLLYGEPGHGKTSLCWMAMYDFYKNGWLSGVVDNVFCFSFNPTYIDMTTDKTLNLSHFLGWGEEKRQNTNYLFDEKDCENSLIFFDAYDELSECIDNDAINIEISTIFNKITKFQEETNSHIVITSRKMAIESLLNTGETASYYRSQYSHRKVIEMYELLPISKFSQLGWIDKYRQYCHDMTWSMEFDWDDYKSRFENSISKGEYNTLVGIPIIFRMIVVLGFLPKKNTDLVNLYHGLFDLTWDRHPRPDSLQNKELVRESLQAHALKLYINETSTAVPDKTTSFPWLFSFYTTSNGKNRVGFLHRSFYHYFLAGEILSWYGEYEKTQNINTFQNKLSYLARGRLDSTTLEYIRQMSAEYGESLNNSIEISYEILKKTDGILENTYIFVSEKKLDCARNRKEAQNKEIVDRIKQIKPLMRMKNTYWNILSIGGMCNHPVKNQSIDIKELWIYDLNNCCLHDAELSNANFRNSNIVFVNFNKAVLQYADLSGADIRYANLCDADLRFANFYDANLNGAIIHNAKLQNANFRNAKLRNVNFNGAKLCRTILRSALLWGANLYKVDLKGASLHNANLRDADLSEADLSDAFLQNAFLVHSNLSKTNLTYTNLSGADLRHANFRGANLYGADLRYADIRRADFRNANLENTIFLGAKVDRHIAEFLKMAGVNISVMIILDNLNISIDESLEVVHSTS